MWRYACTGTSTSSLMHVAVFSPLPELQGKETSGLYSADTVRVETKAICTCTTLATRRTYFTAHLFTDQILSENWFFLCMEHMTTKEACQNAPCRRSRRPQTLKRLLPIRLKRGVSLQMTLVPHVCHRIARRLRRLSLCNGAGRLYSRSFSKLEQCGKVVHVEGGRVRLGVVGIPGALSNSQQKLPQPNLSSIKLDARPSAATPVKLLAL
jgi:hypothetical protein